MESKYLYKGLTKDDNPTWITGNLVIELETNRHFIVDLSHFDEKTLVSDVVVEVQANTVSRCTDVEEILNIEKYKDELIEMGVINLRKLAVINDKPVRCENQCKECDFGDKRYRKLHLKEWLFAEYEEPEVDWSKVKVDTPILVTSSEDEIYLKRYFAKFENGKVYAWQYGATSWTADNEYAVNFWKYAKLAESEE